MAATIFLGMLVWLQSPGWPPNPCLGKKLLQNTIVQFFVLGCLIFMPKPLLVFSLSRWAGVAQNNAVCKNPVLLKPFICGLLGVSQFGMRHPSVVLHCVSLLAANPIGEGVAGLSHCGKCYRPNMCIILSHFFGAWCRGWLTFKKNAHRLVQQLVVHGGLLKAAFGVASKPEQAGHIAFVDGNFQITGRIEPGQLVAGGHGGVIVAQFVNNLLAGKNYFKAAASAVFLKFLLGNVYHHVLKSVDKNNLAVNPVNANGRAQRVFFLYVGNGFANVLYGLPMVQFCKGLGQCLGAGQHAKALGGVNLNGQHVGGAHAANGGEYAIVGAGKVLAPVLGNKHIVGGAFKQVYNNHVEGARRKMLKGIVAQVGGMLVVVLRQLVGNIHNIVGGICRKQLPFNGAHNIVGLTNIR